MTNNTTKEWLLINKCGVAMMRFNTPTQVIGTMLRVLDQDGLTGLLSYLEYTLTDTIVFFRFGDEYE